MLRIRQPNSASAQGGLFIAVQNSTGNVSAAKELWSRMRFAQPRDTQSSFRRRQRATCRDQPAPRDAPETNGRSCQCSKNSRQDARCDGLFSWSNVLPRRLPGECGRRRRAVGVVMSNVEKALMLPSSWWILEDCLGESRHLHLEWRLALTEGSCS